MSHGMQTSQGWCWFPNCPVLYLPGLCRFLKNPHVIKDTTEPLCIEHHGRNLNNLMLKNVKKSIPYIQNNILLDMNIFTPQSQCWKRFFYIGTNNIYCTEEFLQHSIKILWRAGLTRTLQHSTVKSFCGTST